MVGRSIERQEHHGSAPQTSTGGVACSTSGIPTMTVAGQRWIFTRLPLTKNYEVVGEE